MSNLLVDTVTEGREQIQRVALIILSRELNSALERVAEAWEQSDADWAAMREVDYVPTVLESVEAANFHDGHRPSLITAPIDQYPNVAVMVSRSTVSPESAQYDHQEDYRVPLVVEVMVKVSPAEVLASPDGGEEICNRRAQRMVEAVHAVLTANPTLGGMVSGFATVPTGITTQLFVRKEKAHHGPNWLWQGGRIECVYRKESSNETTFRGIPALADLEIDQA